MPAQIQQFMNRGVSAQKSLDEKRALSTASQTRGPARPSSAKIVFGAVRFCERDGHAPISFVDLDHGSAFHFDRWHQRIGDHVQMATSGWPLRLNCAIVMAYCSCRNKSGRNEADAHFGSPTYNASCHGTRCSQDSHKVSETMDDSRARMTGCSPCCKNMRVLTLRWVKPAVRAEGYSEKNSPRHVCVTWA